MPAKTIGMSCFKISILHKKFCTIPCNRIRDRTITRILKKKKNGIAVSPTEIHVSKMESLLFLIIYILYINFCAISSSRNGDQRIPKIQGKIFLQRHLSSDFDQKLTDINLSLDNSK